MQIKGIIFDLDGTLVDTIEDIAGAANEVFASNGMPVHDVPYYLKWIGSGAIKFIERALGKDVEDKQLMKYVAEFREIYSHNLHDKSRVYEGIPQVLNELERRGIQLSVLSNKPHLLTIKVCDYYLSDWPFNPVFGQREEVPRKPGPDGALEIAEIQKIEPARMLFVGDSANDILTARSAGMIPLGVTWGYGRLGTEPMEGDHQMIHHPSELLTIL